MTYEIRPLSAEEARDLGSMTFPAYRHLLTLEPTPRHPDQGDRRLVRPLALGAFPAGKSSPVGLALADRPLPDEEPDDPDSERHPELLSVFVKPDHRRRNVATALVEATETSIREEGSCDRIQATYTKGKEPTAWMERIFEKRGWSPPEPRTLSVQFTPENGLDAPVFEPRRMRTLARGLEIVPWSEISAEELEAVRRSDEESPWVEPNLAAWRFVEAGFDPSSVGGRWKGELVGWAINHRVAPDVVRFTCSFIRWDLSRRGRILPLYRAALENLHAGCRLVTFVTPFSYPPMIQFIRRWIEPISERVVETRGVVKELGESAPAKGGA